MRISIVVPVYNREGFVRRCIDSVLAQQYADFELILVDDGSTDNSLAVVREVADPRLRVIVGHGNAGEGPARNRGVEAAHGDWVLFLDSDDELVPGALTLIATRAEQAEPDVGALFFRCRMDDGHECPASLLSPQSWDYAGYVGFLEETVGQWRDVLRCLRRACCMQVRWPANRMDASKFLLDFARKFGVSAYPDVLLLYHQDAENHLVRFIGQLDPRRHPQFAQDRAEGFEQLLREHGAFLANSAPRLYCQFLQSAAASATLAGRRTAAFSYAWRLVAKRPGLARGWLLLSASLLGPRAAILGRNLARARRGRNAAA